MGGFVSASVDVRIPIPSDYVGKAIDAQAGVLFNAFSQMFMSSGMHPAVGIFAARMFMDTLSLRERRKQGVAGKDT